MKGDTITTAHIELHAEDKEFTPDYRIGVMRLFGTRFHVECIACRVDAEEGTHEALNEDFQSRLEVIENEMEASLQTVKLPDDDREWFIVITPYAE